MQLLRARLHDARPKAADARHARVPVRFASDARRGLQQVEGVFSAGVLLGVLRAAPSRSGDSVIDRVKQIVLVDEPDNVCETCGNVGSLVVFDTGDYARVCRQCVEYALGLFNERVFGPMRETT